MPDLGHLEAGLTDADALLQEALGGDQESVEEPIETESVDEVEADESSPAIDWDSPDNPYREYETRFKGLQGSSQQKTEQLTHEIETLRQQQAQYERALFQAQLAQIPEAERPARAAQFEAYQQQQQAQFQEQQRMAALQQIFGAVNEYVRDTKVQAIANKYGVDPADLAGLPDEETTERFAQRISELAKAAEKAKNRQKRVSQGADRFETGESTQPLGKLPDTFDEASAMLAKMRLG